MLVAAVIGISIVAGRAEVQTNRRAITPGAAGFRLFAAFFAAFASMEPALAGLVGVLPAFEVDTGIFDAVCADANGYLARNTPPTGAFGRHAGSCGGVSKHKMGFHIKNNYTKLEESSHTEAMAKAVRHGLLT